MLTPPVRWAEGEGMTVGHLRTSASGSHHLLFSDTYDAKSYSKSMITFISILFAQSHLSASCSMECVLMK